VQTRRPGPLTVVAFAVVVIVGGTNFVAVRLSNRELAPFYGAGVRFAMSAAILIVGLAVIRIRVPRGRALLGAVIYGVLNFFAGYAFFYWGLQDVPAALGGVIFGTVPLLTFVLAVSQRQEAFRWRPVFGAAIAIAGVVVMVGAPGSTDVRLVALAAVVLSAIGAAETAIVIKHFPSSHPVALNAVAMTVGCVLLLALSALSGEPWTLPDRAATWWSLVYLAPIGSVGLFIGYVYVVQTWTATGASYQFVLFPVVTGITGALIADEPLSATIAIGGALAVAGTYVGALAGGEEVEVVPAEPVG
jgi:drug/metabolite transporter (DMT)-like permease